MTKTPIGNSWVINLLYVCTVAACYGVYVLSFTGGLLGDLFQASLEVPRVWPNTAIVMRETFTGIKPVDWHMNNLMSFWTPIIFRQSEALNLFTPYFMLQWFAGFAILYLESLRNGNQGLAVGRYEKLSSALWL